MWPLAWLTLALTLAACQTRPHSVESPFYQIPAGSKLVLKKTLEFPPDTVSISFGLPPGHPAMLDATCTLQLYRKSEQVQRVKPDTFAIVKVSRSSHRSAQTLSGFVRVDMGGSSGGGPSRFYYETDLFLRSDKQPNVYLLACENVWWTSDSVFRARHLTVAEIRAMLADTFRLELADHP